MERAAAPLGGLAFVVLIFGSIGIVRVLTRALYAAVWFAQTVGMLASRC